MHEVFQASEQMLSDIFASMPDGVSVQDADLNIIWVNPAMEEWFAHSAPLLGKKCYEAIRNAKGPCTTCPTLRIHETGQLAHEIISISGTDGETVRWLDLHSFPLVDRATGRRKGIVEYFRDVTGPKRAEEALQAALACLEGLINATPDLIFFKDADGRLLHVNKACEEYLGVPKEYMKGKHSADFLPPYLAEAVGEGDDKVRRDAATVRGEQFVTRQDGVTCWYDTIKYPVFDHSGHLSGIGGISRDITEIKRIELALRASESQNRLLIDTSPVGIAIVQESRLVYANPALRKLLGYENIDGLIGKPLVELVMPENGDMIALGQAPGSTDKFISPRLEVKALKADGATADIEVWPGETCYEDVPSVLLFVVDITESKVLRAQALHSQKMEAVGTLAAGIAHEFNNLLTVASGFCEILLTEKSEGDPDYSDLQKIAASCARGVELVRKLRFLGRRADNYFQVVDLNNEVIETVSLLSGKLPGNISLDVRMDQCRRKIWADSGQFAQVIVNLLLNATDAMPDGGKLSIKTKHFTADEEYCRTNLWAKAGDYIELIISDTGHGMDRETVSRIFEPFFTTRGLATKSGLGLSVVHGIVQEHGGHIACESEVGQGTAFRIYLPALSYPEQPECVSEPAGNRGGTETILLVDDQDDIRDIGKRILSQFGYTVLCASNAREALRVYGEAGHEIALVILDLIMPEMGGKQCLEKLLALDPHVRVLMASGQSPRQEVRETIQIGAKDVVSKPFTIRQLLKAVRQALDGPDGG